MATKITLTEAKQWLKNLDEAKDIGTTWETDEDWEELIESLRPEATLTTKTPRRTTNPGDCFVSDLCKCRVWNKGYGKQCSAAPKVGEVCLNHSKKITEFGGWAFGHYDEDKPTQYLHNYGKKKAGMSIMWKDESKAPKKVLTPEISNLKQEYKETFGKDPKGPKANNPEWLSKKIEAEKLEIKAQAEIDSLKEEFTLLLGKRPMGPKANDVDWLKCKIVEFNEGWPSSEEEDSIAEDDTEDSDEDDGVGVSQLEDIIFEGVDYKLRRLSLEVFKNGAMIGEWVMKDDSVPDGGWINWESQDFYEIHIRDENYEGEEQP